MKARQLIEGASFGPEALKAIGQAFDEIWAGVASQISTNPLVAESARMNIATAILSLADDTSWDVAALKRAALKILKRQYPTIVDKI